MNARVLGFFLIVLLPLNAGCILPLAIVPVPSVCSGEEVVFQDEDGNPVQADGMLIANRSRYHRFFLAGFHELPSNQIVAVRDGKVRLPSDVYLMIIGLSPNEYVIGMAMGAMIYDGVEALPRFAPYLPLMLIPVPTATPTEELRLIPLLEGYHPIEWDEFGTFMDTVGLFYRKTKGGQIVVRSNTEDPEEAWIYLRAVRERLRRRHEKRKFEDIPDLRLEYYHYNKVRAFIDAELKRIEAVRCGESAHNR